MWSLCAALIFEPQECVGGPGPPSCHSYVLNTWKILMDVSFLQNSISPKWITANIPMLPMLPYTEDYSSSFTSSSWSRLYQCHAYMRILWGTQMWLVNWLLISVYGPMQQAIFIPNYGFFYFNICRNLQHVIRLTNVISNRIWDWKGWTLYLLVTAY